MQHHSLERALDLDAVRFQQLRDQLRVVDDLPVAAERRILVAQRIEGMGVARDDALDAQAREALDQRRRELLEQQFVSDTPHAFAGARLCGAEDAETHAGLAQDLDEGTRDFLATHVERFGRPDVEEPVDPRHVVGAGDHRHVEAACPVATRVGGQPPRVRLHFIRVEHVLEFWRELAVHHHAVLPQPVEFGQQFELDRAGGLAIATGRARPERVLADHVADQRGKLFAGLRAALDQRLALVHQVVLEAVVDPLHRQRLAGHERGARVLATTALGAGEGVERVLPDEVRDGSRADLEFARVRRIVRERAQIDRRHDVGRRAATEEQRRQRRDDVEVFAEGQQHQERAHGHHLRPVRERGGSRERGR